MGQCPAESPFCLVFQVFNFFLFYLNTHELLSNGPYASSIGLFLTKLLGTEFIISHTFQCERYFLLLVLEFLKKYHKGDLAGHCPIYI